MTSFVLPALTDQIPCDRRLYFQLKPRFDLRFPFYPPFVAVHIAQEKSQSQAAFGQLPWLERP